MRRIVKVLLILVPLAILVHDAATGRMSVFRDRYTREEVRLRLFDAVYDGKADEAAFWLRRHGGIDPTDDYAVTLLSVAAYRGCAEAARVFLDARVDVNAQSEHDYDLSNWAQKKRYRNPNPPVWDTIPVIIKKPIGGMTPLHWAAIFGNVEVAKLLIERGANIEARDGMGRTPLLLAVINGQNLMVDLLLKNGADPNAQNASKYTPLMLAVLQGQQKTAELLLAKGAELHITNHTGGTALHVAVEAQRKDMVELLLKHGAEVNAKDHSGRTPLDLAKDLEIQRLLREHGGKTGKEAE
ncbi:MAG: ankyrin repeat domain-containing protein [Planctomycetota bacterium]